MLHCRNALNIGEWNTTVDESRTRLVSRVASGRCPLSRVLWWRRQKRDQEQSMIRIVALATAAMMVSNIGARAETICVKYGACIDLAPFTCKSLDSSFVHRACYDASKSYMLIQLNSTWYHYCGLDQATWTGLNQAASVGTFYNQNVKGRFDCRLTPPPTY
jgi:hypothetical protein